MEQCFQQITWHLKRKDLLDMLMGADYKFSAIEFKTCIEEGGVTNYYMSLVDVNTGATDVCTEAVRVVSGTKPVCPVPPDCNRNKERFIEVLTNYHHEGKIDFQPTLAQLFELM